MKKIGIFLFLVVGLLVTGCGKKYAEVKVSDDKYKTLTSISKDLGRLTYDIDNFDYLDETIQTKVANLSDRLLKYYNRTTDDKEKQAAMELNFKEGSTSVAGLTNSAIEYERDLGDTSIDMITQYLRTYIDSVAGNISNKKEDQQKIGNQLRIDMNKYYK